MKQKPIVFVVLFTLLMSLMTVSVGCAQRSALAGGDEAVYLPAIFKPLSHNDLAVTGIEVIQATQRANNSIPLVDYKPAVARVYAEVSQGSVGTPVMLSLQGQRGATSLGTVTVGPMLTPNSPTRSDPNSTFNVVLPNSWLDGSVQLTAMIDSDDVVPEASEVNNSFAKTVTFHGVPTLDIKIVPFNYTHIPNGQLYPAPSQDHISDWIARAYPLTGSDLAMSFRTPVNVTADFSTCDSGSCDWVDVLVWLSDVVKFMDGAPLSQAYYGYIPIQNSNGFWFSSGVAGIGWIFDPAFPSLDYRIALGLDLGSGDNSGILAGHEIGHNFGRRHAPCGGASGTDPSYPYGGAIIGEWGLDYDGGSYDFLNKNTYRDWMSYCSPEWVSDYNYEALYDHHVAYSAIPATTAVPIMLVRGTVAADGSVAMAPVYTLAAAPTAESAASPYTVEFVDAAGQVVSSYGVGTRTAEEMGVSVTAISAAVPLPEAAFASVRLMRAGVVVAERPLAQPPRTAEAVLSVAQTAESISLTWGQPGTPAVVRYTVDDGASWTTLAGDWLGGTLTVDATTLPGGENGRFELILANTAVPTIVEATLSQPLPDQTPIAWITGPTEMVAGSETFLQGRGSDLEDGVVNGRWWLNGEEIAVGGTLSLSELPVGDHAITFIIEDSSGQTAQQTITVSVLP